MHLWVNGNSGAASNSTSRASNTADSPWANPLRGTHGNMNRGSAPTLSEALQPGDTLHVVPLNGGAPYTFDWVGQDQDGPVFAPANSGNEGEPIIITGDGAGFVLGTDYVKLGATGAGSANVIGGHGNQNTPGSLNKGWYEWRGFRINENEQLGSDSWPCAFQGCHDYLVEYCDFIGETPEFNATLGRLISPTRGDNHNATRHTYCLRGTVQNCRMRSFYPGYVDPGVPTAGNQLNGNACEVYWSAGIVFRNNDVGDCATGVYYKAPNHVQDAGTAAWAATGFHHAVYKNKFDDCNQGIAVHRLANVDEANGFRAYQNLLTQIRGTVFRFHMWNVAGDLAPVWAAFFNNTVVATGSTVPEFEIVAINGTIFAAMNGQFKNNIVSIAKTGIEGFNTNNANNNDFDGAAKFQSDRNCWDLPTNGTGNFLVGNGGNLSYGNFRNLPSGSALMDPNSITTAPVFVNAGAGDYRLADNGQAHRTLGRALYNVGAATGSVISIGAYINTGDVIGIVPYSGGGASSRGGGASGLSVGGGRRRW